MKAHTSDICFLTDIGPISKTNIKQPYAEGHPGLHLICREIRSEGGQRSDHHLLQRAEQQQTDGGMEMRETRLNENKADYWRRREDEEQLIQFFHPSMVSTTSHISHLHSAAKPPHISCTHKISSFWNSRTPWVSSKSSPPPRAVPSIVL